MGQGDAVAGNAAVSGRQALDGVRLVVLDMAGTTVAITRAMALAGVDDPARVIVVGDTDAALQAARNAAVGCSNGVLSGAHGRERLAAGPHTVLLDSVADLRTWLFAPSACT